MVRQGIVLRSDALLRERNAARIVEARYASLIANASDVIMVVDTDGTLRFVSPASARTLGFRPEEITGKRLLDLCVGEDGEKLQEFLAKIAATPAGMVGPVELRITRDTNHQVLEGVGSNLTQRSGGARSGAQLPRYQRAQSARGAAAAARLPRSADAACESQPVPRSRAARAHSGPARTGARCSACSSTSTTSRTSTTRWVMIPAIGCCRRQHNASPRHAARRIPLRGSAETSSRCCSRAFRRSRTPNDSPER